MEAKTKEEIFEIIANNVGITDRERLTLLYSIFEQYYASKTQQLQQENERLREALPKWFKLSDAYPSENTEVIIRLNNGEYHSAFFSVNNGYKSFDKCEGCALGWQNKYIVEWCYLPVSTNALNNKP